MSHYATVEMKFLFEDELIQALESVYGKGNVEVHEKPQHIFGYEADEREQVANIIVRRKHISRVSNDLGFLKTEKGYTMFISDYDQKAHNKTKQIVSEYATRVIKNRLTKGKYRVKSESASKLVLQVR